MLSLEFFFNIPNLRKLERTLQSAITTGFQSKQRIMGEKQNKNKNKTKASRVFLVFFPKHLFFFLPKQFYL